MPRKRKTLPPQAENAQAYGEAGAQLEAQRAIPLPADPGVPTPSPVPQGRAAPPPIVGPDGPHPSVLEAAMAGPTPDVTLRSATLRPDEPVTAGLDVGPGPGRASNPLLKAPAPRRATTLALIAEATGDPTVAALAAQAFMRGR